MAAAVTLEVPAHESVSAPVDEERNVAGQDLVYIIVVFVGSCKPEPVVGMAAYVVVCIGGIAGEESDLDLLLEDIRFVIGLGIAVRPASEVPEECPVSVVVSRQEPAFGRVPELSAVGIVPYCPEGSIRSVVLGTVAPLPYGIKDGISVRDKGLTLDIYPSVVGVLPSYEIAAGLYDISVRS